MEACKDGAKVVDLCRLGDDVITKCVLLFWVSRCAGRGTPDPVCMVTSVPPSCTQGGAEHLQGEADREGHRIPHLRLCQQVRYDLGGNSIAAARQLLTVAQQGRCSWLVQGSLMAS